MRILKGILKGVFITTLALAITVVTLNLTKPFIYSEYYSVETELCENPGLSDGFVCQGICISEETGVVLVSGYMTNGESSRVYVVDLDGGSYYISLLRYGESYDGHMGGIGLTGDTVYLANGSKIFKLSLADILAAENGDCFELGKGTRVNNKTSFAYADENYVYVGEYHCGCLFNTDHPYTTPTGENHAIITRYARGNLDTPDKIYSIPDKVQGVCFTPDGKIIFSTSHGIESTVYLVYDEAEAYDSGHTLDGTAVYFLGECKREIKGPAMGQGLDYYEGDLITLTECASDKYVFGKFFFADDIVRLKIQ